MRRGNTDPDATVGESRQGIDKFPGETLITDVLTPHPDLGGAAAQGDGKMWGPLAFRPASR